MAENQYGERVIRIEFPFDEDVLEKVRSIPGRKWHKEERCWSAPIHLDSLNSLKQWGFLLDEKLITFIRKVTLHSSKLLAPGSISGLQGELYPFQAEAVAFLESKSGRALIADDMGLGKTIEAIAYLQLHPELRPAIIVSPAFLKLNWQRECIKWMNRPNVEIISGTRPYRTRGSILIINYDILSAWYQALRERLPEIIIFDEAHFIKTSSAKRTKASKMLVKGINHIIGLSGTPIENRAIELYNIINMLERSLFPNKWHYIERYCALKHNGFGWNYNGSSNSQELHQILTSTIMLRRRKNEVLKELPDKTNAFIPVELEKPSEYKLAERDFIAWIAKEKGLEAAQRASNAETFSTIEGLKQLAVKGKLSHAKEWIRDFLESGNKLVVFATHHFVIDELMKEFGELAVKVDGRVSMSDRQNAVDKFQNDENVRLFVGNIEAAGVGITLTAASDVAFLELPWTPAKLTQAADRVHRIGQKNSVTIYYLLANDTIEERIAHILDNKSKTVSRILDGEEISEESLLTELMKEYNV